MLPIEVKDVPVPDVAVEAGASSCTDMKYCN